MLECMAVGDRIDHLVMEFPGFERDDLLARLYFGRDGEHMQVSGINQLTEPCHL